jgi:hypothetical protein
MRDGGLHGAQRRPVSYRLAHVRSGDLDDGCPPVTEYVQGVLERRLNRGVDAFEVPAGVHAHAHLRYIRFCALLPRRRGGERGRAVGVAAGDRGEHRAGVGGAAGDRSDVIHARS